MVQTSRFLSPTTLMSLVDTVRRTKQILGTAEFRNRRHGIMITSSTLTVAMILGLTLLMIIGTKPAFAFPDGAPGEACTRHKPNHGGSAQPLSAIPFSVTATSSSYKPGQTIAVRIAGKPGTYFKGFFVQASDERGRWVGTFEPTSFSVSHPECAATTHSENHDKEEITLVWHAPKDAHGTVRFLASILKNYKVYWVDAPAATPESKPRKASSTRSFLGRP